jgi:ABC-2 type transport system permease protein
LTKNQIYSFTPQTLRVVKGIKDPVTIYAFYAKNAATPDARNLLSEYNSRNSKIHVEYVDPYQNVPLAMKYGISRNGTLVFVSKDKVEQTPNVTETDITSALIRLENHEKVQVTFWTGNGEKDPESPADNGLNELKTNLEKLNYTIVKQNPNNDAKIASNTGVLVLAGPQAAYSNKVRDMLSDYLSGGGRALVMLDATQDNKKFNIEEILGNYGIAVTPGLTVEPDPERFFQSPLNPGIKSYQSHKITENLDLSVYFGVEMVKPADKLPNNAEVKSLMETSPGSWLAVKPITGTTLPPKAQGDVSGPISLGVAMKFNAPKGKENDTSYKTRLVVIGDSDFGSNTLTSPDPNRGVFAPGNVDLFVNSMNWLSDRYNINAAPKDRTPATLTLSDAQKRQLQYLVLIVLPGLALLMGIVVWRLRRQNRMKK